MKKFSKKILMLLMAIVVLVTPTFTGAVRQEVHNDRNYNWYIDQGNTGWASNSNCGPSSSVMVEKWFNRNTIATAAGARDRYPMQGGWWSTNTVSQYLNDQRIPNRTIVYNGEDTLTDILDNGNIAIVCVNTGFISFNNNNNSNIGRFYNYQGGHFLVVKGYTHINNRLYFEVYDPNNWGEMYFNGQPKGKDRLYAANELSQSIFRWCGNIIVIG